jgi:hypothetical protein
MGKKFLMDDHLPIIWERGGHDKGLRLHLHHIWPRGKPRKLIRASSSIKLARARWAGSGSRLANEDHCSEVSFIPLHTILMGQGTLGEPE